MVVVMHMTMLVDIMNTIEVVEESCQTIAMINLVTVRAIVDVWART